MLYLHKINGFSYTLGLIPINWFWATSTNGTKTTTACAGISKYHEGCSAGPPTLTHIWTIATFTNSMKTVCIYKIADMFVIFANRKLDAKPIGFLGPGFI